MNKQEAEKLLKSSREEIDKIDDELLELILKRTSLAKDIITSKKALDMDIFDASRENIIHENILKKIEDKPVNTDKILQIFDLLASISKEEQKKYL